MDRLALSIELLVDQIGDKLKHEKNFLTVAESCTAGGLAYAITGVPGTSAWFDRGFVVYSNEAKQEMLNVNADTIASYGAVSQHTAREMAEGAIKNSKASVSISVTGIAGPAGGTVEKPVGTVWFGWAKKGQATLTKVNVFAGDRKTIREQAIEFALQELLNFL